MVISNSNGVLSYENSILPPPLQVHVQLYRRGVDKGKTRSIRISKFVTKKKHGSCICMYISYSQIRICGHPSSPLLATASNAMLSAAVPLDITHFPSHNHIRISP